MNHLGVGMRILNASIKGPENSQIWESPTLIMIAN